MLHWGLSVTYYLTKNSKLDCILYSWLYFSFILFRTSKLYLSGFVWNLKYLVSYTSPNRRISIIHPCKYPEWRFSAHSDWSFTSQWAHRIQVGCDTCFKHGLRSAKLDHELRGIPNQEEQSSFSLMPIYQRDSPWRYRRDGQSWTLRWSHP